MDLGSLFGGPCSYNAMAELNWRAYRCLVFLIGLPTAWIQLYTLLLLFTLSSCSSSGGSGRGGILTKVLYSKILFMEQNMLYVVEICRVVQDTDLAGYTA